MSTTSGRQDSPWFPKIKLLPGKFYKRGSQEETPHPKPELFLLPAHLMERELF
jgi:hypothetical protein